MLGRQMLSLLAIAAAVSAPLPGLAAAQSAADALACYDPAASQAELASWFANMSRERNTDQAAFLDLRATVYFVGNLDGGHPETWEATREWAHSLAVGTEAPQGIALFQQGGTAVEIGSDSRRRYCLLVSDRPLLADLAAMFGNVRIAEEGMIRRLHFNGTGIRVLAHELSTSTLDEFGLPENHHFVATFVVPAPSEVTP